MPWNDCLSEPGNPNSAATLQCLPVVFNNVVQWALTFAGIAALFFIILSGYKYMSSGGDPKQAGEARQTLTYAIIGLLVILFSFLILNIISYVTGVGCITLPFGFDTCK